MITTRRAVAFAAIAFLAMTAAPVAAQAQPHEHADRCRPSVRALPDLGQSSRAYAFNRHQVFVGRVTDAADRGYAARWDRRGLRLLTVGMADAAALDVNDSGMVLGEGIEEATGRQVAWVWHRGRVQRLAGLGGDTYGSSINEHGTVVGVAFTADGNGRAVRWTKPSAAPDVLPQLRDIGGGEALGINDRGQMVGRVIEGSFDAQFPVSWDRRHRIRPLPDDPSQDLVIGLATSINNRGQVTGGMSTTSPEVPFAAVRWSGGRVTKIGNLPGDNDARGRAIAENGWIAGSSARFGPDGPEAIHAFFWSGRGPIKALPALSGAWEDADTSAYDVDSAGTVSGWSTDGTTRQRATVWTCGQAQAFVPATSARTTRLERRPPGVSAAQTLR